VILEALSNAKAVADLADWRKVGVHGRDALAWLDGLLTGPVNALRPGSAQRCLLLDERGRLQADVTVAVQGSTLLLIQDPAQLRPVNDLLSAHLGGTDVELEDRTRRLSIFAFPHRTASPDLGGTAHYAPSALGPGSDLVCMPEDHDRLLRSLQKSFALAGPEDLEAWRITAGRPRVGIDAFEGDLPMEAGLMAAVDLNKGDFLGKAALAALGPEPALATAVVALQTGEPVSPGQSLSVRGRPVGELTSVTAGDEAVLALGRVSWDLRAGPFTTEGGMELEVREVEPV